MSKKEKKQRESANAAPMTRREEKRARHLLKHGRKWLWIQRDTINAAQMETFRASLAKLEAAVATRVSSNVVAAVEEVERQFHTVKPHGRWSGWRENFEAVFVALVIAGAVRTYFVQPFKIPTGSMQPTLYGTYPPPTSSSRASLIPYENGRKPGAIARFLGGIVLGKSYFEDGYRFSGDRIFVDRFTCNFVRPKRGDVVVFRTRNMPVMLVVMKPDAPRSDVERVKDKIRSLGFACRESHSGARLTLGLLGDKPRPDRLLFLDFPGVVDVIRLEYRRPEADFYIKRLVGMGGEKLRIRNGQLEIDDEVVRSPAIFQSIYSRPIAEHANLKGYVTIEELGRYDLDRNRPRNEVEIFSSDDVVTIPKHHIFVLGDNTANSTDSRYWGTIPRRDIIGRAFLIYWPWSERTGCIR